MKEKTFIEYIQEVNKILDIEHDIHNIGIIAQCYKYGEPIEVCIKQIQEQG